MGLSSAVVFGYWQRVEQRIRRFLSIFSLVTLVCFGQGCANTKFHNGNQESWKFNLPPQSKDAFGASDLMPVPTEPLTGDQEWFDFYPQADPVVIQTYVFPSPVPGPVVTLRRQVEAHLFARDPQEVFSVLSSIGDDRPSWLQQTMRPSIDPSENPPWTLPDDVVVPYPFKPHFVPKPTVLRPIIPADFWHDSNAAVRGGPGNEPLGAASVKALRLIPVGLCSTEQPIQDIIKEISDSVTQQFLHGTCKPGQLDGEVQYLDEVSYLGHHPPDKEKPGDDDVGGGFFFHGKVRIHDSGAAAPLSLDDCSIAFNYDFRFYLEDGRLALFPTRHKYDYDAKLGLCSGELGNKGGADILADSFQIDLENEFLSTTTNKQILNGPDKDPHWDCSLGEPIESSCSDAANQLAAAVSNGSDNLKIQSGGPSSPSQRLIAAVRRPENWRCQNHPDPPDACRAIGPRNHGRCEFMLRAKRLNVTPDAVELVWFDNMDEYDNPALALFVASLAAPAKTIDTNAYRRLCSRPPSDTLAQSSIGDESRNYYNRRFAKVKVDDLTCSSLPPYAETPAPICPCAKDTDCAGGVQCDNLTHQCKDVCLSDDNCEWPQPHCYQQIERCGGNTGCALDGMCQRFERCNVQTGHCELKP